MYAGLHTRMLSWELIITMFAEDFILPDLVPVVSCEDSLLNADKLWYGYGAKPDANSQNIDKQVSNSDDW